MKAWRTSSEAVFFFPPIQQMSFLSSFGATFIFFLTLNMWSFHLKKRWGMFDQSKTMAVFLFQMITMVPVLQGPLGSDSWPPLWPLVYQPHSVYIHILWTALLFLIWAQPAATRPLPWSLLPGLPSPDLCSFALTPPLASSQMSLHHRPLLWLLI